LERSFSHSSDKERSEEGIGEENKDGYSSLAGTWLVQSLHSLLAGLFIHLLMNSQLRQKRRRGAGEEGRRLHKREAVYEALPLALQRLL